MVITDIITTAVYVASLAVSIATLRILVVTLKETIDLNRKQLELITFELNKAAREIRPEFLMYRDCNEKTCSITIICEKNIAFNVTTSINFDAHMDDKGNLIYQSHKYEPFYKVGDTVWTSTYPKDEDISNGFFRLEFMDDDGRKYEQRLFFNKDSDFLNDRPVLKN
ncbi:hypothetical protein [Mucilaginibacter gilvus]|uniref:Uncharacterized protein n=1 Tax=Mucilaginibacter gilvus TaxID=2305909 RepID=A0A3S3W8N9_9SPHI|nr:hypothetical protein [Mucilaginibacter gilvus]RWY50974.1 hypothetical protein EPL05_12950 [Mucilaginibacter gilvus]